MACCTECPKPSLLKELKDLVNQIGESDTDATPPCAPCCVPCTTPYAQVTMTCPPPILAPTVPEPVKPLQLPCPPPPPRAPPQLTPEEAEKSRFDNFYNNYNIDYHNQGGAGNGTTCCCCCCCPKKETKQRYCEDYRRKRIQEDDGPAPAPGCPTGFKPCSMKMTAPPCCDPCGVWIAQVQPCPPKPKIKKSAKYEPGPCMRKCCKHWQPKEGPCLYDDPCKAHCYNHPPGIKPSGRYP